MPVNDQTKFVYKENMIQEIAFTLAFGRSFAEIDRYVLDMGPDNLDLGELNKSHKVALRFRKWFRTTNQNYVGFV